MVSGNPCQDAKVRQVEHKWKRTHNPHEKAVLASYRLLRTHNQPKLNLMVYVHELDVAKKELSSCLGNAVRRQCDAHTSTELRDWCGVMA
jgi:hypothetical protein